MKITRRKLRQLIIEAAFNKNSEEFEDQFFDSLEIIKKCVEAKYGEDVGNAVYTGLNAYFTDPRANDSDLKIISNVASAKSSFPDYSHLKFEDEISQSFDQAKQSLSFPEDNTKQSFNKSGQGMSVQKSDDETDDEFNSRLDQMIQMAGEKGADFFKNLKR